jgi:outer membrane receptor protein involved in Fe transport
MPKLRFALQVRNLLNKYPPADETYTGYPYYDDEIYDILGREVMLTATWKISD